MGDRGGSSLRPSCKACCGGYSFLHLPRVSLWQNHTAANRNEIHFEFPLFPNISMAQEQTLSLKIGVIAKLLHIFIFQSLQNNALRHLAQSLSDYYFCLSNPGNIILQNVICGLKLRTVTSLLLRLGCWPTPAGGSAFTGLLGLQSTRVSNRTRT